MPYQGDDWNAQPFRYLGKVSPFTQWPDARANSDSNVAGLSAIGYGQTDFAASYQSSRNVLGFNDLGADLRKLGTAGAITDKYLSYHIVGWYSNPAEDPIRQLPARVPTDTFTQVLSKVTNPGDAKFLSAHFQILTYALQPGVTTIAGQSLWAILQAAGYPLEVDIPLEIDPAAFRTVLEKTPNPTDQNTLKQWYTAQMAPVSVLTDLDRIRLWNIMAAAGYDFTSQLLARAKWSLLSGTVVPEVAPSFTLYLGFISNVKWNAEMDYFTNNPSGDFNIAIGNTPGEALSALIANTSGFPADQTAVVEEILDALQAGILPQATTDSMLNDWELLKGTLHKNSFGSRRGGYIWEVQADTNSPETSGEVTLPTALALQLNDLNVSQLQLNEVQSSIDSVKSQIFADWYRFMWINYPSGSDPSGGIDPGNLAQYVADKISHLQPLIGQATDLESLLTSKVGALRAALGSKYFLAAVAAPRYWQPNDPVVLFQGAAIQPSERYGRDGRYMADDSLVCRLGGQLLSSVQIPPGAFGNAAAVDLGAGDFDLVANPDNDPVLAGIDAALVDGGLLNEDILAAQLRAAGLATPLGDLAAAIGPAIRAFLTPEIPQVLAQSLFEAMSKAVYPDDAAFLQSWYTPSGTEYTLNKPPPGDEDRLRLRYILNSTAYNPSAGQLAYVGSPFSEIGMQVWDGNPWLPYSLQWSVYYYPFLQVPTSHAPTYPADFITSNFKFGDTDLEYSGAPFEPDKQGIQVYQNTIFLTPHANINLREQLKRFIAANPNDPLKAELQSILGRIGDKPVLSQAMSGFNEALLMLQKEMQLPVSDPNHSPFYDFTNSTVHDAVAANNTERPAPGNSYNPIRVGLMNIASITLVDVFGRNVLVQQPEVVYRAQSLQQTVMQPVSSIYLPPRLTEAARLLFRWLSAADDGVEMNTHPATTPVCGWVLANHLDSSLWVYDNRGNAYGSLALNWNSSRVLWQCAPGSIYFGLTAPEFFQELSGVNPHLREFVLALYGDGGSASAQYLDAFMRALDVAEATIEPANFAQYQTSAVLLGRPLALVRAALDLELMGGPAYSQSWPDLKSQVDQDQNGNFVWGNDYGFSRVNFPVKIGNVPQTSDGLIGYFKNNDYGTFFAPAAATGNPNVSPPPDDNIQVNCSPETPPVVISMLVEPRGVVHATTGVLPVKTIDIPPDQYTDALEKLCLTFLTAPVLTSKSRLAMPLPAQSGGFWTWVENDGPTWSQNQDIAPVTVDAVMNYAPQKILEGWLNLSNALIAASSFQLVNTTVGKPVLIVSNDPARNPLTLTWTNSTNTPLVLNGGAPVSWSYQVGGSSLAFNFGTMLPAPVVAGMQVSAPGWTSRYFVATTKTPALWAVAPDHDLTLAAGASVVFDLNGTTCPPYTVAGKFQIYYFALPDFPDNVVPLRFPVAVQR